MSLNTFSSAMLLCSITGLAAVTGIGNAQAYDSGRGYIVMGDSIARLNALLNEFAQTADHSLRKLRETAGPNASVYVRTQYNSLLKAACGGPTLPLAQLANAVLEGSPSPRLDRGMNDRIREAE